jgi:hypothetical protein
MKQSSASAMMLGATQVQAEFVRDPSSFRAAIPRRQEVLLHGAAARDAAADSNDPCVLIDFSACTL